MKPIRVLIVDDSIVFREIIRRGLRIDKDIEVIATAIDPYDARDKILQYHPDVITCDIEMPKMNGIKFIKKLMPQYPLPIIVVSSISEKVFEAMEAGAVDFITKPSAESPESVQEFILYLTKKIKEAKLAKIHTTSDKASKANRLNKNKIRKHKLIAIGASTGGTEAIYSVLKQLPTGIPGIVVVQHIPPVFSTMFAERLNKQTDFIVSEAKTGDIICNDHVYLAPGDKHIQVKNNNGILSLKVSEGSKVNGHCPSVDVLFLSVASALGKRALGVILTGMGYDGAKGAAMMKRRGAITLGQDEKSSVVYGMPKAAYEIGGITKQVSLELMGHQIMKNLE